PIPTCGNPAAITALPQPPSVSQNVPIASALSLRKSMSSSPALHRAHARIPRSICEIEWVRSQVGDHPKKVAAGSGGEPAAASPVGDGEGWGRDRDRELFASCDSAR